MIPQVTAGNTFSLFLADSGEVYAAGSSESGQLGNGKTGERLLKAGKTGFDLEVPARTGKRQMKEQRLSRCRTGARTREQKDYLDRFW